MEHMGSYKLAAALLQFKYTYSELVKASKEMPDYDFSVGYPFFLLDFEEIAPNVLQWCSMHAAELMKQLPDRVDNPACVSCKYMRSGIAASGLCKAPIPCNHYPIIPFSRELTMPFFITQNIDIKDLSDDEMHLLYIRRMEQIYAEKNIADTSSTHDNNSSSDSSSGTRIE